MYTDVNPSIVCGLFCKPSVYDKFVKHVDNKHGMRIRELRFIDIGMPLDERYDDAVNHLKHFSMPMLKKLANMDFPMSSMIFKAIQKKGFKKIDLCDWKTDIKHRLLFSGLTPLFVDWKYSRLANPKSTAYTDEEEKNMKKLLTFESNGYEPDLSPIAKNQEDTGEFKSK